MGVDNDSKIEKYSLVSLIRLRAGCSRHIHTVGSVGSHCALMHVMKKKDEFKTTRSGISSVHNLAQGRSTHFSNLDRTSSILLLRGTRNYSDTCALYGVLELRTTCS